MRREVLYNILVEFGIPMKLVRLIKMYLNKTCSKVCIGKHFSNSFPIQNGLRQGDALLPLLFNSACDQNADQNWDIKIGKRSFENVSQFKYLGKTVTNQYLIQEEIKRRLNSGNACCHSVQKFLSSCLLSKHVKIGIYKNISLSVVLYRCETWSVTLREENKLRQFWNRVLRRIF
jgi:hypothetical protein